MTTLVSDNVINSAAKLAQAGFEVKTGGKWIELDGQATDEDRDWIAGSIADEADPAERKRLVREIIEVGLAAMRTGKELAREVLKAAGQPVT